MPKRMSLVSRNVGSIVHRRPYIYLMYAAEASRSLLARCQFSFMPLSRAHTTAPTFMRSRVNIASRNRRAFPLGFIHCAAVRVSPEALVTWTSPRKRTTEAKAEMGRELHQMRVAQAAIGEDRCVHALGQRRLQPRQTHVLDRVALACQFRLEYAEPHQRRGAAVTGDQIERQRRLVIGVVVGPIHDDQDGLGVPDRLGDPRRKQRLSIDFVVADQTIDLLDRVLVAKIARHRQGVADRRYRQAHRLHRAIGCVRQRPDLPLMQRIPEHALYMSQNRLRPAVRLSHPPVLL